MRIGFKCLIVALVAAVALPSIAFAQTAQRKPANAAPAKFDPHDLTGVWQREGDRGINPVVPEMTAEGLKKFNANKPSYGRPLGAPLNGEHIGRVRAVPPAQGNSLVGDCNPPGVPRLYFEPEPVEFIQAPDKLLQFFSWTRAIREVWTDGRSFPQDVDALMPTWYGYNIGKWQGDTFVVESLGYDERSWLDHFGYPHSGDMRMQERFRRVSADSMEMTLTINDPAIYKTPWVSQKNIFKLVPKKELTLNGWYGFLEGICAPIDEGDFNSRVRNPAGGVNR
jgi:hypothetical protein